MMEPSILAPQDAALPDVGVPQYGDPWSRPGPNSNGRGSRGGIGDGDGGGVGPGRGQGAGPGERGGIGGDRILGFYPGIGASCRHL